MRHPLENKIIELIRKKDKEFISLIYDNYADSLYGIIHRIVNDTALAEDVLQDSFIKIWKRADQFDPAKARLFTWLLAICRNTAIDKYRSVKNRSTREIQINNSNVYEIKDKGAFKPQLLDIKDLMYKLDHKYQQVIEALFFQGMTQKEASEALDIPLGTVKTRLKIGLRELRNSFGEEVLLFLITLTLWQ